MSRIQVVSVKPPYEYKTYVFILVLTFFQAADYNMQ